MQTLRKYFRQGSLLDTKTLKTWVDEEQYSHDSKLPSHRLLVSHKGKMKLYKMWGGIILWSPGTTHQY